MGAITKRYFIPVVGRIQFRNLGGKYISSMDKNTFLVRIKINLEEEQ